MLRLRRARTLAWPQALPMNNRQHLPLLVAIMVALATSSCAHGSPTQPSPPAASNTSESEAPVAAPIAPTSEPDAPASAPAASAEVVHDGAPCAPLAEHLTRLAGDGAKDCGSIAPDGERREAWSCVDAAHRAGSAFKVVLFERGKDSMLGLAWTRDAGGQVTRVWSDSDPTGSGKNKLTMGTKACPAPQLRSRDAGLERGELFECAPATEPERRCRSHAMPSQ
jgi:hypothetical protein